MSKPSSLQNFLRKTSFIKEKRFADSIDFIFSKTKIYILTIPFFHMKKRGQFYLIAAVVIVAIILGLSSVTNYIITKRKPVKFYDLSSELNEESVRVVDYGVYNEEDIPKIIENFTDEYFIEYAEEKEKGTELVFVYGNKDNVTVATYTSEQTGEISINYGATTFVHTGLDKYVANRTSFVPELVEGEYRVRVYILGVEYDFKLQEGENFLFVMAKKTEEETYIIGK